MKLVNANFELRLFPTFHVREKIIIRHVGPSCLGRLRVCETRPEADPSPDIPAKDDDIVLSSFENIEDSLGERERETRAYRLFNVQLKTTGSSISIFRCAGPQI